MYSTSEAAEKLGLSQDHVRLLARTGVIEAKKLGHDWVVLNLDYKRKRRSKETKYFELTPPGKKEITRLEHQGKDDEASILRFLLNGRASVLQISDETNIVSSTVRLNLKQFKKENWIIETKAEAQSLEEEMPAEGNAQEERLEADTLEQETPEEEKPDERNREEESPESGQSEETLLVYDF